MRLAPHPPPPHPPQFFRLYASRLPPDLFDRLRYIIAVQDWDFVSHTFWLKHGVALLFDCLNLRDPITLAYNSGGSSGKTKPTP